MFFFATVCVPAISYAQHPLITDDAGTQGKGKFQFELNGQYGRDNNGGVIQYTTPSASAFTYGVTDTLDLTAGVPYIYLKTEDSGSTSQARGFGDIFISLKWKLYENKNLSFAVKPGITFSTGDKEKTLGLGKSGYSFFFIITKELKPWAIHMNLGYLRNDNRLNQRKSLWHVSVASELSIMKGLRAVANIGIQRNAEKASKTHPAFLLGGLIYSINEHIDIDAGYKYGLTKPEVDYTVLAGLTLRI